MHMSLNEVEAGTGFIVSNPTANSVIILRNTGVHIYFECNV